MGGVQEALHSGVRGLRRDPKTEMPVKRAGQILNESDTRMWRMRFVHVKAAHARFSFDNVVWVGADEMNRRKGHNYLTVFADLVDKRVVFAAPGKDASV
jgi:transposase